MLIGQTVAVSLANYPGHLSSVTPVCLMSPDADLIPGHQAIIGDQSALASLRCHLLQQFHPRFR